MREFCACLGEDSINASAEATADNMIQSAVEAGMCPKAVMAIIARAMRIIEVELSEQGDLIRSEDAIAAASLEQARISQKKIEQAVMALADPVLDALRDGRVVIVGVNDKKKRH